MDFAPMAAMATLIITIINFFQYARARSVNGLVTTLAVWVAGVVVVVLAGQTDFAEDIHVTDTQTLGSLNNWSLVFVGLTVASMAAFAVQIKKAIDNGDTAAKPPLVG